MARFQFRLTTATMLVLASHAAAQEQPPAGQQIVAATVAGEPIYASDVAKQARALIERSKRAGRELGVREHAMVQATVLSRLIDQRLVAMHLAEQDVSITQNDVDQQMKQIESQLVAKNPSLAEKFEQDSATKDDLRRRIEGLLSWDKYVEAQLTDDRLEEFFNDHRADFDGTEVYARHILLQPAKGATKSDVAALVARAEEIRKEIVEGKISFADAANKYSQGPSGLKGGDLGFLPRRGMMGEPFSTAAFGLDEDQISPPVITRSGIHLIQVTQRKPGNKKWSDVRKQLSKIATNEMRLTILKNQLGTVPVEFTGALPHFKLGTRKLVIPERRGE